MSGNVIHAPGQDIPYVTYDTTLLLGITEDVRRTWRLARAGCFAEHSIELEMRVVRVEDRPGGPRSVGHGGPFRTRLGLPALWPPPPGGEKVADTLIGNVELPPSLPH